MDSEKSGKKYIIVIIILILLIVGTVALFMYFFNSGKLDTFDTVSNITVSETVAPKDNNSKSEKSNTISNPIDFKSLQKRNEEIVAWIKVPDTNIDYPVVQSLKSDDYYLHRDINGNSSYAGSIYMEYCNSADFTDRVTLLYGHNMQNGSMFANLHRFENPDFFKKHRYFYVYLPDKKLTYEVVSAHNYSDRHIMNSFNFTENKVFKSYLDYILNPRSTVRNVRSKLDHKLTTDDRVLTLSTCLNSGDGRYLLQGVLVKDEFAE